MKKMIIALLAISSVAGANELDDLVNSSNQIVQQITKGIQMVGAAQGYAHQGDALSTGEISQSAHISGNQLNAYNTAVENMVSFLPYGNTQLVFEEKAATELDLMDNAIDQFTEVVVDMMQVIEVADMSESAATPQEQEDVQDFVVANAEVLTITQEEVETYNQSLDDIETHANNASAYLAIAGNDDAVSFFESSIESANTTAEETSIMYDANRQWVQMGYNTTRNLSAVYLNGSDGIGLDLYVSEADILLAGSESDFFLTSPVASCYMYGDECE